MSSSSDGTTILLKNDTKTYTYKGQDERKIMIYSGYDKYVRFDIYYKPNGFSKEIVGHKAYLRETNEDVTNIQHEGELREKIGLYGVGIHTDELTFVESTAPNEVIEDDGKAYRKFYIFKDDNNNKYNLQYIYKENPPILTEGKKYKVTFETKLFSLNCYDELIEVK